MQRKFVVFLVVVGCLTLQIAFTSYYLYDFESDIAPGIYHCCYLDRAREGQPTIDTEELAQYGRLRPGRKYAVFTASIFGTESANYAFDLPLTAMAWRRIGFDSVVIIVGDPRQQKQRRWLQYLMEALTGQEHIVVVVLKSVATSQAATISQVSRLFAASLLRYDKEDAAIQDIFLVTSDADVWPIAKDFFLLPPGKDILHGDIGYLSLRGYTMIHVPISYVGMTIRTWRQVMSRSGSLRMPNTTAEFVNYFGEQLPSDVTHGGIGWYLDQKTVSLRLHEWKANKDNARRIHVYNRQFDKDRIDRMNWPNSRITLARYVDAHILQHGYRPEEWKRLKCLLKKMCPDYDSVKWYEEYAQRFYELMMSSL